MLNQLFVDFISVTIFLSLNRPILLYVFKYAACTSATCQINYNFKNVQASQNTNLTILQIIKALKKSSTK